ncbi:MAG: UDP-N-acetylmuramoyl-tripeptide--D-alanyl-D-alanine ligase, partial [Oceanihabitans sp.]|nr:UDP-N-acetylmuramoyl-tripeptide--D-alanyl-D-alanine ligase [Oceanihabitans sp.]
DDAIQTKKLDSYIPKYGFSQTNTEYYTIELLEANPFVQIKVADHSITSNLIGAYNFTNLCAATSIAKHFDVSLKDIKTGIESYTPKNNRSQIITIENNKVILDAYNANPSSMQAALTNFSNLKEINKVVLLGDMFELGSEAEKEHQNIAQLAMDLNFAKVYLIGENFFKTETPSDKVKKYNSFEAFKIHFEKPNNATLLIKGSRGMALERTLDLM